MSRLDVADMREQVARARRAPRRAPSPTSAASSPSSPGTGWRRCSAPWARPPLDGGPTLNPSTYELLAGIHSVPAEQVVVLPNSGNVRMAADRAAELSDKSVRVVASRSQQAGLAAAVALDVKPLRRRQRRRHDARRWRRVRTGAVTAAARDDGEHRFRAGEAIGFVEEELVAWGDAQDDAALRARPRWARRPSCSP